MRIFCTKIIPFIFLTLLTFKGAAAQELHYTVENFSARAHKMMGDHGVNALYTIKLQGMEKFLPVKHDIKRRSLKKINRHILPGKTFIKILRYRLLKPDGVARYSKVKEFFASFREGVPYTYAIAKNQLSLTESTGVPMEQKYRDRYSKHYIISHLQQYVNYAGEMHFYKNQQNREVFVVVDNASGTYLPDTQLLPNLIELLNSNFGDSYNGLYFQSKRFDQKIDKDKLFQHNDEPFITDKTVDETK